MAVIWSVRQPGSIYLIDHGRQDKEALRGRQQCMITTRCMLPGGEDCVWQPSCMRITDDTCMHAMAGYLRDGVRGGDES